MAARAIKNRAAIHASGVDRRGRAGVSRSIPRAGEPGRACRRGRALQGPAPRPERGQLLRATRNYQGLPPIGALAINRSVLARLPYDPDRDLQPVSQVAFGHLLLAVYPRLPVKTVRELLDYGRANPGKLLNASSGNGSPGHVGAELFKLVSGVNMQHVPYKGGGQTPTEPARLVKAYQRQPYRSARRCSHTSCKHRSLSRSYRSLWQRASAAS